MMEFDLPGFAAHLAKMGVAVLVEQHNALEHAARVIEAEAKAEIGTYQGAAGPFAAWPSLAESTKADRVAKGFPADEPLLRTGDMRDSIEHTSSASEAHVGSNDDKAVWQELGTSRGIPPRSFLGGAAFRKAPEVAHHIGHDVATVLMGGSAKVPIT